MESAATTPPLLEPERHRRQHVKRLARAFSLSDTVRMDAANPHQRIELTEPEGEEVEVNGR